MALLPTQIDPVFQNAFGRNATDYEVSQYENASTQDLANVPNVYNSLNKDSSIVDYLKYNGQDPSMSNRQALASKYGISNVGTAEGNMSLLKALQTGSAPAPVATNATNGTVTTAASTAPMTTTPATTTTTAPTTAPTTSSSTGTTAPVGGSISSAATSSDTSSTPTPTTYTPDPQLAQSLSAYQDVQSQIQDIDTRMAGALQNAIREIGQTGGGPVDESQLQAGITERNAPLLALRAQLVSQQSQLGKQYQSLLAADKQNRSDFNTAQSRAITEQNNTANQGIKEQQLAINEQKTLQSGVSVQKENTYDEYGTVTGQRIVLIQKNPDGTSTTMPAGVGGVTSDGKVNPSYAVDPSTGLAVGTTGSPTIDVTKPGYTTTIVPHSGNLTQSSIDLYALSALMNNGKLPSLGNSSKGVAAAMKSAIIAREGELDPGGNLFANNANAKALAQSLSQQIAYSVSTTRSLQSAQDGLNQLVADFTSKEINTHDVTIQNVIENAAKYQLSPKDIAAYNVASHQAAADILNGNISIDALKSVGDELQKQGEIVIKNANDAVASVQQKFNSIISGNLPDATTSSNASTLTVDQYSQYSSQLQSGEVLATDSQGNIVAATPDDISSGKYTAITKPTQ